MPNESKLDYFIARTDDALLRIEIEVRSLSNFKMRVLGGAAVIAFLVSVLVVVCFGK